MTIEMWLRARPGENPAEPVECRAPDAWITGNVVLDRNRFNQGRKSLCGRTRVDDDVWHHVAVTRAVDSGAVALYVDGLQEAFLDSGPTGNVSYPDGVQPQAACGGQPCTNFDPFLVLGAEKHDVGPEYPSFSGVVDDQSTAIRYRVPFPPAAGGFAPDPATAALYHFDGGSGPVSGDELSGPTNSDGMLQVGGSVGGPLWVVSDAPTGR